MPQNHFREPKNRREHLLSSLPIVLPVAAVTISAAAFGLLFLQGNPVESVEESLTYTAAIGAADEQVEMYVYDAGNDEVEEAEEEASEMNAASSYAAKERIFPAGEVEDTAELVDAYSSVPLFVSSGNLAEQGVQTRLELLEDYFPNGMYWNHVGVDTSEMTADEIAMCVTDTPCNHSVYGYGNCNIYNGLMDDFSRSTKTKRNASATLPSSVTCCSATMHRLRSFMTLTSCASAITSAWVGMSTR